MDCETIDNYKLSRLEILFNQLFGLKLFKSKRGFDIFDLGTISVTLVVGAIILGLGATILEQVGETINISTANASSSSTLGVVGTLAEFIPIIAIVAVVAIIIGVVTGFFGRSVSSSEDENEDDEEPTDSDGYTSMSKFKVAEDKYNRGYYKEEPDYDDAKKSLWDKIFKKRYNK